MARAGRTRRLGRGETLFVAGDESADCATLVSGALKVAAIQRGWRRADPGAGPPGRLRGRIVQPFVQADFVALTDAPCASSPGTRSMPRSSANRRLPARCCAARRRTCTRRANCWRWAAGAAPPTRWARCCWRRPRRRAIRPATRRRPSPCRLCGRNGQHAGPNYRDGEPRAHHARTARRHPPATTNGAKMASGRIIPRAGEAATQERDIGQEQPPEGGVEPGR